MFPNIAIPVCATCGAAAIAQTYECGAACPTHYPRSGPLDQVPAPDLCAAIQRFRDARVEDLLLQTTATAAVLYDAETAMYLLAGLK